MVHVDHTGPEVSVLGLRGRLGRHGLYVHNSTDLSAMTLAVRVSDEHSGVHTIGVSVGTSYLSDDVAHGSVGVQRLDNVVSPWINCICLPVLICGTSKHIHIHSRKLQETVCSTDPIVSLQPRLII